jgi:glycerophosphoryl diester phosphodiesterase
MPRGKALAVTHPLLDPSFCPLIAHRGASADAPENTIPALRLAVEQGCDVIEVDVRATRDGVAVLLHDPTLDRTTDRRGVLRHLDLVQVRTADAGAGYVASDGSRPWAGRGLRIPTLEEALEELPDFPFLLEPKTADAQEAIATVLRRMGATRWVAIASFERGALQVFRGGPFLVGSDRRDVFHLWWSTLLGRRIPPPRCAFYAPPDRWKNCIEVPRAAFVAEARRHGRPVHVWTVDDPDRARLLWRSGVSGIITNRPSALAAARNAP